MNDKQKAGIQIALKFGLQRDGEKFRIGFPPRNPGGFSGDTGTFRLFTESESELVDYFLEIHDTYFDGGNDCTLPAPTDLD